MIEASYIHANANYYFQTIKNTGMVKNAKEGFEKVLADEDGTFAFIHEASQVFFINKRLMKAISIKITSNV